MENQIIEQFTAVTTKSYETMKNLSDINASALRKITDLQFDFISMSIESGIEQAKSLNNKTEVKDIFASNVEFASDYNEKLTGFTNQTVEVLTESGDETKGLFEKVIASVATPVRMPAKAKATKETTAKPAAKKSAKKAA